MSHEENGLVEDYNAIYEAFIEFSDLAEDFLTTSRKKRLQINNQNTSEQVSDTILAKRVDEIRKEERELISNYYKLLDALIRLMKLRYDTNQKFDDMLDDLHKVRAKSYGSDDVNQVTETRKIIDNYEPKIRKNSES